jgi:CheY-like chemotaxis protein
MSLPHLLLVDDSDAILAFETAALSAHYAISTAHSGREALEKLAHLCPAAVLLDLSMPEMDGEDVLRHMRTDARLRDVPVIVISSEKARARACLAEGAQAYLPKPIRADELLDLVGRVLDEAARDRRRGSLQCLFVWVGGTEVALPLDAVRLVLPYPATRSVPTGPAWLCEAVELHDEPVLVLDLALRLQQAHTEHVVDRKLVVVRRQALDVALSVDRVRDPEEIPAEDVLPRDRVGGTAHGALPDTLVAMVRTPRGTLPVIDPLALLDPGLLERLVLELKPAEEPR